jgi:hypothetical protein
LISKIPNSASAQTVSSHFMKDYTILCDIGDNVNFIIGGSFKQVSIDDLADTENLKRIYRIQFKTVPDRQHLEAALKAIRTNPEIELRFYGDYSEEQIDWNSLMSIEKLQIDLWETKDLKGVSGLTNLKRLGITKNVKSSVSMKIVESLTNLEVLYTSISKDIACVGTLTNLRILSLREIKAENIDFLKTLKNLEVLYLSLGSYQNFQGIAQLNKLKKLSIHQVRGFDSEVASDILTKCKGIEALELQDLKHFENLDFLNELNEIKYLRLEGTKNLLTYGPILNCKSLETLSVSNGRPVDKSLKPIVNLKNIALGDSYAKSEIDYLTANFNGQTIWLRGKELKGRLTDIRNPFRQ